MLRKLLPVAHIYRSTTTAQVLRVSTPRLANLPITYVRARNMASSASADLKVTDPKSVPNPLGEGQYIKTAGCIVIGDEVLNGKTKDTNSNFLAQFCFDLGIELKRIEVIADDEEEIVEAARRMTKQYDFVVTSGGIGPTHDDITYSSLGAAFNLPLQHDPEVIRRMWVLSSDARKEELSKTTPAQKEARERMALFPTAKGGHGNDGQGGPRSEVLFVSEDKWVPVLRLGGKLCVFPGIPTSAKPFRHLIFTKKAESVIAPFLTELQARVKKEGIRIGSYPMLYQGVHVSLIGHDVARIEELGKEVEKELDGTVVASGTLGAEKETAKI